MRIMIADDEPKIRRGLMSVLEKSDVESELIVLAKDGEEALQLAEENDFDLILVDVCMPKIDGLELIRRISQVKPEVLFVIISGYDEFAYAREAVQLRVYDYLLKPIEENNLIELVKRLQQKILFIRKEQDWSKWKDDKIEENEEHITNLFFSSWCEAQLSQDQIAQRIEYLNIDLYGSCIISAIKVFDYYNASYSTCADLIQTLHEQLKQSGETKGVWRTFINSSNFIIIITKGFSEMDISSRISNVLEENGCSKFCVFFSEPAEECIKELPEKYETLITKINQHDAFTSTVFEAKKFVDRNFTDKDISLKSVGTDLGISSSYLSRLMKQELGMTFIDYLTMLRLDMAESLLRKYKDDIKVYEVADKVGYSSHHYFCKVFKKATGMAPKDYIRSLK